MKNKKFEEKKKEVEEEKIKNLLGEDSSSYVLDEK